MKNIIAFIEILLLTIGLYMLVFSVTYITTDHTKMFCCLSLSIVCFGIYLISSKLEQLKK